MSDRRVEPPPRELDHGLTAVVRRDLESAG
jgi:hypothetical protein